MHKKVQVDAVIANVRDLEAVLANILTTTGQKPFTRTTVDIDGTVVPLALVMFGDTTLEFIACGRVVPDARHSHIAEVTVAVPEAVHGMHELEPGLRLMVQTGHKPAVLNVSLYSTNVAADITMLDDAFGLGAGPVLNVHGVVLHFQPMAGVDVAVGQLEDAKHVLGWRRVAFTGLPLADAVTTLTEAGAAVAVPPFCVMPGLWEAMFCLPSGLVVQPVEQHLWKMLLGMAAKKIQGWLRRAA